MEKFQAYLKMIISTFKEQPFQTLQQHDVSWEKSVQFCDIQDLSLMTLKPTGTKTQWLKINRSKIFRKNRNGFCQNSVSNTSARLQLSAVILTIRNWHHIVQTRGTWIFLLLWKCMFLGKIYSLWQCTNSMVPSRDI